MACEIIRIEDDLIFARVTGVMRLADQKTLQNIAGQVIARGWKVWFIAILEDFQGWKKGVDWSDIDFLVKYDADVAKMAIVGDKNWKEEVFAFVGKGFRTTEIAFFERNSLREAESWIRA
ncbi:MAG: STAS/SEC14 domain-containing protein [Syntrophobacteraceae bacterium]